MRTSFTADRRPTRRGHDGAGLAAAAVCGLVASLWLLLAAVDAVAPALQPRIAIVSVAG
jgi:hypothetical protein